MKELSRWVDHDTWVCQKHVPSLRLPAKAAECWYRGCQKRPPETSRPTSNEITILSSTPSLCAWESCNKGVNGSRALARKTSKYCSRDCSNKNARSRHKKRKSAA